MRVVLLAFLVAVSACREQPNVAHSDPDPRLAELANRLARQTTDMPSPLALSVSVHEAGGQLMIKYRLKNISSASLLIRPDTLPWNTPYGFGVFAITIRGGFQPIYPATGGITNEAPAQELAAGDVIEGERDMDGFLRVEDLPRDEDVLLVWSYNAHIETDPNSPWALSGVTLIRKSVK